MKNRRKISSFHRIKILRSSNKQIDIPHKSYTHFCLCFPMKTVLCFSFVIFCRSFFGDHPSKSVGIWGQSTLLLIWPPVKIPFPESSCQVSQWFASTCKHSQKLNKDGQTKGKNLLKSRLCLSITLFVLWRLWLTGTHFIAKNEIEIRLRAHTQTYISVFQSSVSL